jgi:phage terminase large subunit-like protein
MPTATKSRTRASSRVELGCQNCSWEPQPGELWPTYGPMACKWIETNCICGEGDFYGQRITLRPDQKRFVYRWYEYCPNCDYWRYDEAIRTEATGGGKTTFIGSLAALEFAGPPELSPSSPNIVISAASFEQADLLFTVTATMFGGRDQIATESPLCGYFDVYDTEVSRADGRPGKVVRIAAVAGTNEGGQPTTFICDEVHEWGDVGSNKARVRTVVGKSTRKRRVRYEIPQKDGSTRAVYRGSGRILNLSTAGFDIRHSLFGQMIIQARKAERDPSVAPKLLFDHYEAPDGLDFEKAADRRIAVTSASCAAGVLWDVESRVAEWNTPLMPKHEWLRYYANLWVDQAADSWLADHPGAWAACQGTWELQGDEPAVLAVDMALKHDTVAVVEARLLADGRYAVTAKVWEPNDSRINHREVFDWIETRAEELGESFLGLVYDPKYFELPARDLEESGYDVIDMPQSPERMIPAVGLVFEAIVNGTLVHDGDQLFTEQVNAAAKRPGERGFSLSKGKSRRHIDAAVAMAMAVWTLAELDGQSEPSVTECVW